MMVMLKNTNVVLGYTPFRLYNVCVCTCVGVLTRQVVGDTIYRVI